MNRLGMEAARETKKLAKQYDLLGRKTTIEEYSPNNLSGCPLQTMESGSSV